MRLYSLIGTGIDFNPKNASTGKILYLKLNYCYYLLFRTALHTQPELLDLMNKGDRDAFATIYKMTYLAVFRICLKIVDEKAAAQDVTAETFIRLWKSPTHFDHPGKLESYLFTTAHNASIDYLRSSKRKANREWQTALNADQTVEIDFNEQVRLGVYEYLFEQIHVLPPKMQEVIRFHLQGLSNSEIAARMNIAEKSVRNLKSEAIKLLRNILNKEDFLLLLLFFWDK